MGLRAIVCFRCWMLVSGLSWYLVDGWMGFGDCCRTVALLVVCGLWFGLLLVILFGLRLVLGWCELVSGDFLGFRSLVGLV